MRYRSKNLRSIRQQLEAIRPQSGPARWGQIFRAFRIAGQPRSVSAAMQAVLLVDLIADENVGDQFKAAAREKLKWIECCAAYEEIAMLDQAKLSEFLGEYRANGYREPKVEKWVEAETDGRPAGWLADHGW